MNLLLEKFATHPRMWRRVPFHLLFLIFFSLGHAEDKPKTIVDEKGQTFYLGPWSLGMNGKQVTFETRDHVAYKDAFIFELQKDGVMVAHGRKDKDIFYQHETLVKFEDLPPDLRKKYDYRTRDLKSEFFSSAEGFVYMSEKGVLISVDNAEMTIPHDVFTKGIREKYDTPNPELDKRLAEGIDGIYSYDPKGGYFAASSIKISADRFVYYSWSDVPDPEGDKPIEGTCTTHEHWLHLENPKLNNGWADYVFAMVNGQLALFDPRNYREWKQSSEIPGNTLYWNKLK